MARVVTILPAKKQIEDSIEIKERKKVAAYARVSTDSEEQLTSYNAQVSYYEKYICSNEDWIFVGVYTDEGISGTSRKKREGFNNMLSDALAGRIDLILTKSISRFARNTVDTLTTVRQLKEKGVEVYFEKENIHTLDSKGELLITIMSSLAQEESRSISENVKWGQRKSFSDGKVSVPYGRFMGYDRDENGRLKVNPEQAGVVKLIYKMYLSGLSYKAIAGKLMAEGVLNPSGKEKWHPSTIKSMLSNEKYKGDALLQKTYSVDFLSKKRIKNKGEIQQYYVENDHEAIISPQMFDLVQAEMQRRSRVRYSSTNIFAGRIRCGCCCGTFGAKVWHSNDQYRRVIYQCNDKFSGNGCKTPHITEEEIKVGFINAFNKIFSQREELIENVEHAMKEICDCTELRQKKREMEAMMEIYSDELVKAMEYNAALVQNQELYQREQDILNEKYENAQTEVAGLEMQIEAREARKLTLQKYIDDLKAARGMIRSFDAELWISFIDCAVVDEHGGLTYRFRDGSEIKG